MKNEIAPAIMQSMLNRRVNTYNVRNFQDFVTGRKKNRLIWSANAQLPISSTLYLLLETLKDSKKPFIYQI